MTRIPAIPDPGFDPRIADWLEDDPDFAPGAVLDTVLAALPSVQQRRASRVPWRLPPMQRFALPALAVAAVVVVLGGVVLGLGLRQPTTGSGPTPIPSQAPVPTASGSAAPSSDAAGPSFSSRVTELTVRHVSPLYGYAILGDPTWTFKAATVPLDNPKSTDATALDSLVVSGTDTAIQVEATAEGGKPYTVWLAEHHADVIKSVPPGCDGGDPARWPTVQVGPYQGLLDQLCNAAEVDVLVGDWVYEFNWANQTFSAGQHLELEQFKAVLATVTFPSLPVSPGSPTPSR